MKARIAQIATVIALACLGVFAPAAGAAEEQEPTSLDRVSDLVRPSIAHLTMGYSAMVWDEMSEGYLNDGKPFFVPAGTCSGFFVSPNGHIGTAAHCVEYDQQEAKLAVLNEAAVWAKKHGLWHGGTSDEFIARDVLANFQLVKPSADSPEPGLDHLVHATYSLNGETSFRSAQPARLVGLRGSNEGDVAVVKIDAENTPALELASGEEMKPGTPVITIGHSAAVDEVTDSTHDASFKSGEISSRRTMDGGKYHVYELNVGMAGGMSGGPTVDIEGRVVGVNVFGIADTDTFNYISPASELREMLGANGVEAATGELSDRYRAGVEALHAGDRDEAISNLQGVLQIEAKHRLARDLLAEARELPAAGLPVLPLAAVLLAGLLAGGVALVVRRSRRGGDADGGRSRRRPTSPVPAPTGPAMAAVSGPLAGQRFEVGEALAIGRETGDLVVADQEVSRRHAELRISGGELVIADLGSSNGTEVNGRRIEGPAALAGGDRVQIGSSEFTVELGDLARDDQPTVLQATDTGPVTSPSLVAG